MERGFRRSVADEWEETIEQAARRRLPPPPRGELTEGELHEFLRRLSSEMVNARWRAGLTQEQVAAMMDTTKSSVSRLERFGPNVPSLTTLCRYANAIDCRLQIRFVSARPDADLPSWLREEGAQAVDT
jgi:DNA-binding XRE family transcriptional regulator